MSAYSRWALIRDWVLSRINTILTSTNQFNGKNLKKGVYIELSQVILLPKPIIVSRIVFPMLFYLSHFSVREKNTSNLQSTVLNFGKELRAKIEN